MAQSATVQKQWTTEELKAGVLEASSYCALALATRVRALSVDELIAEVGGLPNENHKAVFDAIADGFQVFDDARCRDML